MVNSPLNNAQLESLLSRTKGLLRQAGLQAKKGLGQHFLVDGAFLKYILTAAELTNDDVVIEVGPGLGVLTVELAERVRLVVAIEKDDNLAALLAKTMKSNPNVLVINEDILRVEPAILLRERLPAGDQSRYKVVANLPYYITSPVLRLFLEASFKPQIMVVMVQKEVARQITAKPGDMSLLSIAIQLYGLPKIVKYVPARAFYPAPDVDSAILKINIYARPVVDVEPSSFFTLVRAGFSAARKQLVNSISHRLGLPKTDTMTLLQAAGIDPTRRAETLSLEEWGRLWRKYTEVKRNDR
jgi:16S rRNA (adenine1518-N6/adenine1519-N6)-dimethyltransferase